ncbi:MAG: hypothetical protein Faunusvirus42_3 [Faunusvirus sp.]|jgi:hypothetical protein|uniref:Uncharacterized protein n=1 Tax=Faunusvirus sp. TaxID=2487766 RepID=A0A3G4ZXU0_9VIRU|nr:MAG: hypothetical protein Faunusvirus42_3 [Faunusvirus sp.]
MSVKAHRDKFIKLVDTGNEYKCIKYINKYDDFYDTIYYEPGLAAEISNMLIYVCKRGLSRVAIALIDKNCDLTYQDNYGYTALMIASSYGLHDVVAYIINNQQDTTTRCSEYGYNHSEMIHLCHNTNPNGNDTNIIKMINRGYDIYYKSLDSSLFTAAIQCKNTNLAEKLIDIDINFVEEFKIYCEINKVDTNFYNTIVKYINNKHADYKDTIIATMNDASPANMLYQSFRNTYAVALVDVICDFILLKV